MNITKVSLYTHKTHTRDIHCTQEQMDEWLGGKLIQDAMPDLSTDDREFLISGMTPEEWKEMMG